MSQPQESTLEKRAQTSGSYRTSELLLGLGFAGAMGASLLTSALILAEVIPGSPLAMSIVVIVHLFFALGFFGAYRSYRALFALVAEGEGSLFLLAITGRVERSRSKAFQYHYTLRAAEGLALLGLSLDALRAMESALALSGIRDHERKRALCAGVEANLQLNQNDWARRSLDEAKGLFSRKRDQPLSALEARLQHLSGQHELAIPTLRTLVNIRAFPFTDVLRSRHRLWLAEALHAAGSSRDARRVLKTVQKAAPNSQYAKKAHALQRTIGHDAP